MREVATPTEKLAAKRGETDPLVRIKRNYDALHACSGHVFAAMPDWRERSRGRPLLWLKVPCTRCGAEMNADHVLTYLRGVAHGSGQNEDALISAVFPS